MDSVLYNQRQDAAIPLSSIFLQLNRVLGIITNTKTLHLINAIMEGIKTSECEVNKTFFGLSHTTRI